MFSWFCYFLVQAVAPPGFVFNNQAYFSLFPIDTDLCPKSHALKHIILELYTTQNPIKPQSLVINNDSVFRESNFDFNKSTVICLHGFLEGSDYGSSFHIRKALIQRGDHNVIIVNAQSLLAGPWYYVATKNTRIIGQITAKFLDYLVKKGYPISQIHLIGHSLGSHSAGFAGKYFRSGKIRWITALDPALPFFENLAIDKRLDKSDAEFVDVIHTAGGLVGLLQPLGDVDFYPNGGRLSQPGCTTKEIFTRNPPGIFEQIFCSHWRSFLFYSESIINSNKFTSFKCNTWKIFNQKSCNSNKTEHMGFGVSKKARGIFFLETNLESPFSKF